MISVWICPKHFDPFAKYGAGPVVKKRDELLEACWASDAVYSNPMAYIEGRAAIADHFAGAQHQFPGSNIDIIRGLEMHHNYLPF